MPNPDREPLGYSGIFLDSSKLDELKRWYGAGIISGATTNPSILAKEGVLDVRGHIKEMIRVTDSHFPISVEVPYSSMLAEEMVRFGLKYNKLFPGNVVIKIPVIPSEPWKSFQVIKQLGEAGVRTNATVGITMGSLVGAAEAQRESDAKGDNYLSLFWGRSQEEHDLRVKDEADKNIPKIDRLEIPDAAAILTRTLTYLFGHGLRSRVIVGSIRNVYQIEAAFGLGADIVTIPPKPLVEWMDSRRGRETIEQFDQAFRDVEGKIKI